MSRIIIPSPENVSKWLLETLQHAFHVEYFLHQLNFGVEDPDRPHDITGRYSKFDWDVIRFLARQYESDDPAFFEQNVLQGILLHREQYHHRMWNKPDLNATDDAMKAGAIDTICVFIEDRPYAGGKAHRYDEILNVVLQNPRNQPLHIKYIQEMLPKMQALPQPNLERIVSLENFPNIGLPEDIYQKIIRRVSDTLRMLQQHGYECLQFSALPFQAR